LTTPHYARVARALALITGLAGIPACGDNNTATDSGIATAVVNVGIFLGTGVLQPLVGWVLDRGREAGDVAGAWDRGILILAGTAACGALCTLFIAGPRRGGG
jgi:hypothetical protein